MLTYDLLTHYSIEPPCFLEAKNYFLDKINLKFSRNVIELMITFID